VNIAILSCKNIRDETCIGCHRCLMGFDEKEGEFERYRGTEARLRAIVHCGGCPGTSPVMRLVNLRQWMAPMEESIDVLHIGNCLLDNCPYKETILQKVKAKAGIEVVEGTHPYKPVRIFGT